MRARLQALRMKRPKRKAGQASTRGLGAVARNFATRHPKFSSLHSQPFNRDVGNTTNPHTPATPITRRTTSHVLSTSACVNVGCTKNMMDVSPNSLATGSRSAGRQPVPSKAFAQTPAGVRQKEIHGLQRSAGHDRKNRDLTPIFYKAPCTQEKLLPSSCPDRARSARLLLARPQQRLPVWKHLLNVLSNRLLALAQQINLGLRQRI